MDEILPFRTGRGSLVGRFGADGVLRAAAWIAALGVVAAPGIANAPVALLGHATVGFGIANVDPVFFRSIAPISVDRPERAVSAVTTTVSLGFLAGPTRIGVVAASSSLAWGLGVVAVACAVIALAGKRTMPAGSSPCLVTAGSRA